MSGEDILALGEAVGWPLAICLFMAIVLAKNGWFKVILRDTNAEQVETVKADIRSLWKENARTRAEMAELKTDVAVLLDRSERDQQ